jgi:hypothetical protein
VINISQLEQLAQLQSRQIQRQLARAQIEEFIAWAIADLEAAMEGIPDCSAFLARWRRRWSRLRLRLLRRIDEEEAEDQQFEGELWEHVI